MVGDILRKKREESGQDLREISDILRIKYDYLKSLEEGTFEKLPQEVYIKGYIRKYAEHLQIDPQAVIDAYIQQTAPAIPEQKESFEKKQHKSKRKKTGYLLILLFMLLIAIPFAYIIFHQDYNTGTPSPLHNQKDISPQQPETVKQPPFPPAGTSQETLPTPAHQPAPLPSAQTKQETVRQVTEPVGGHVLKVFATETTWLLVRIDNTHSKEMILKPGDSADWHAEKGFSLTIGNASGIRLLFNGKEMKNLGSKGQVIKIDLPDSGG